MFLQVRLHVKIDPEETENWIIPAKGKTNDLFFYGDEQLLPTAPRRPMQAIKEYEEREDDEVSAG